MASATYDAGNQQTGFGGGTLTYDLNGNLTGDGTHTYAWTARNQLGSVSGPIPASFVYDAVGRRQRKTINGVITDFVYDGLNPVREAAGASTVDLLTGLGIDEYLTRTDSAGSQHLLSDALGSTVSLADSTGTVQTDYSYEPFGRSTASGATSGNELRYTGREDDGTGVYYYRARYYHPGLQRFISEDPIGFADGQPNLYAYVANNPVAFSDQLGLRIDWSNQMLRNPAVVENLWNLNDAIVSQGVPDSAFTLRVSGGDRYRDCAGRIVSASNDKPVRDSDQTSRHLYENGAVAVDLVVTGISMRTFRVALSTTSFDPRRTLSNYPNDPHVHIELPALYNLPLNAVPDQLTGRKDVCR